jgi:hypothetical protein
MKANKFSVLLFTCLLSVCSLAASAQPFVISADGSEVTDQKTGLIWRRCSEGMSWNGTICAGSASTYTHEAALTQASTQATSTGVAWRLPNIKELTSIADKTLSNPAIDATAFPGTPTPAAAFWSSSPYASLSGLVWDVDFIDGGVYHSGRTSPFHVRLVRAGQ